MDRLFNHAKKALDSTTQLIAENQTFRNLDIAGFRGLGHSASHSSSPPATTHHGSTTHPFHTHASQAPTTYSSTMSPPHASPPSKPAPYGSNLNYPIQSLPPTTTSHGSIMYTHPNQPSPVPTSYASTMNPPHQSSPTHYDSTMHPPQTHSPAPAPYGSAMDSPSHSGQPTTTSYGSNMYSPQFSPAPAPYPSNPNAPSHPEQQTTASHGSNMYSSPPQFSPAPTPYPYTTNAPSHSDQPTTTYSSTVLPPPIHSSPASMPYNSTNPTSYPPQPSTTPYGPTMDPSNYPAPPSTTPYNSTMYPPPTHSSPTPAPYSSATSPPPQPSAYNSQTSEYNPQTSEYNPQSSEYNPQPSAYNETNPTPTHSTSHTENTTPAHNPTPSGNTTQNSHAQSGLTFQQKLQAKKNQDNLDNQLMQAVVRNNAEQVETLLKQGADVNALVSMELLGYKDGVTPLFLAAYKKHNDILRILLRNDANVDAYSNYNHATALSTSITGGNLEACEELLGAGANPNLECAGGNPLLCTLNQDSTEFIELLVMAGADVNAKPKDTKNMAGDSILGTACAYHHTKVVKYLISVGAKVEDLKNERQYQFAKQCMEM